MKQPLIARINHFDMAYDDAGQGPAVILIHGFPLCRAMWQDQSEALVKAGYRVITPDLRGFGDSEATTEGYRMDQLADDVAALMDHLGIDHAVVGGMSMGGYVLHSLLERHGKKVSAALFMVTRSGADNAEAKEKRTALAGKVEKGDSGAPATVFEPILFAEETLKKRVDLVQKVRQWMVDTAPEALVGALAGMRDRKDYLPELSRYALPALVIGGELDICIPPDNARETARRLPRAQLVIIPGAGHMANMEAPLAVNSAMISFLKEKV